MEDNAQNSSNYIQIDALVELLHEQIGKDYSGRKAILAQWIVDAENFIGTGRNTEPVKNWPIDVQKYLAKLPPDCYKVSDVSYCVQNSICGCGQTPCVCANCSCGNGWNLNGWGLNGINYCSCGAFYEKHNMQDWRRQGCFLLLPFQTGGVTINYTKIPVDSAGLPMILEEHLNAIVQYAIYRFTDSQVILGRMSPAVGDRAFARWGDLCAQARGADLLPTSQRSTFAAEINNNPRKMRTQY